MDAEKRAMIAGAIATIGEAQADIMHALTFLALECGADTLPTIRDSVDKFTEWLQTHHGVVAEAEPMIPRTIVVIPPLNLDVL
jgi:hypothetical protein